MATSDRGLVSFNNESNVPSNNKPKSILKKRLLLSSTARLVVVLGEREDDINTSIASTASNETPSSGDSSPERRVSDPDSPGGLVPDDSNNNLSDIPKPNSFIPDLSAEKKKKNVHFCFEEPVVIGSINSFGSNDSRQQCRKNKITNISDGDLEKPKVSVQYHKKKKYKYHPIDSSWKDYLPLPVGLGDAFVSEEKCKILMDHYDRIRRAKEPPEQYEPYYIEESRPPIGLGEAYTTERGFQIYREYLDRIGVKEPEQPRDTERDFVENLERYRAWWKQYSEEIASDEIDDPLLLDAQTAINEIKIEIAGIRKKMQGCWAYFFSKYWKKELDLKILKLGFIKKLKKEYKKDSDTKSPADILAEVESKYSEAEIDMITSGFLRMRTLKLMNKFSNDTRVPEKENEINYMFS